MQNCSLLGQSQCETSVAQKDCTLKLNECPPHAESAPVFTDQTKALVSTNSEQALESKSNATFTSETTDPENLESACIPNIEAAEICNSLEAGESKKLDESDIASKAEIKCEQDVEDEAEINHSIVNQSQSNCDNATENQVSVINSDNKPCNSEKSSANDHDNYTLKNEFDTDYKFEKCDIDDGSNEQENPSIKPSSEVTESETSHRTIDISEPVTPVKEGCKDSNPKKSVLRRRKIGASYEEAPSPENELKGNRLENRNPRKSIKESKLDSKKFPVKSTANQKIVDSKPIKELARNPVKVVIHRIRKSDTDTWHVPNNNTESSNENQSESSGDGKLDPKSPNIGPQIIILSPAMSQKKFGFRNSVPANSVITVKDNNTVVETVERNVKAGSPSKKVNSSENNSSGSSPDKKRGRPIGSKNKSSILKKKKGRKGNKKKKLELIKHKIADTPLKAKKVKIFSGPYVHITGSKENPSSISVINVAQKEEEKINNKIQVKRNFSTAISRIKKKQVGHLSTLSPTYDAFNRDKTWLCVFCHKGSHHGGLGDLYGPYYIKDKNPDNDTKSHSASTSSSSAATSRTKRRKSDIDDSRPSKRARQTSGHSSTLEATPIGSSQKESSESETADMKEVWIHEDCAVWCQSISLMSEEVRGLEEAVNEARENICCHCSLDGATVGCWGKSCKEQYHFSCAKETGCQMDIENFSLLCPKHQKKFTDKRNRCQ